MSQETAVRRRRRSHLLAAAAILAIILAVGFVLEFVPASGPKIGAVPQPAAPASVTPFGKAFARGVEAMRLGDAAAAALAFDEARSINPHIAEAHINLGFAYLAMKRAGEAATAFDRALTIDSGKVNAYYGLGSALDATGDRKGAIGAMRTFIHLAADTDPFKRKARAALWEWEAAEKGAAAQSAAAGTGNAPAAAPKTETAALAAKGEAAAQGEAPAQHAAPSDHKTPTQQAAPATDKAHGVAAAPTPLPAIAQAPEALTAPNGMISIVNVWASWCGPCRAEMPSLQTFAAALDPARYRLVGLNIDKDRDFAREFIRDTGVSFGNFWDGKGIFARERFQVESYPQTLFLDANGALLARVVGAREWPAVSAEATVAEILATGSQKKGP